MASIITTIALDEESRKIAKTLPNLSHFVRECLYRYASNIMIEDCEREKPWRGTNRCNPFVQPVCFSCWPSGSPPRESVVRFFQDSLSLKWLDEQAMTANRGLFDLSGINTSSIQDSKEKEKEGSKVGFFANLMAKYRHKVK